MDARNDNLPLDKRGEFPVFSMIIGGAKPAKGRGGLFVVIPYRMPVLDEDLARRMADLVSFQTAA